MTLAQSQPHYPRVPIRVDPSAMVELLQLRRRCVCMHAFSVHVGGMEREREAVFPPVLILTLVNDVTDIVD